MNPPDHKYVKNWLDLNETKMWTKSKKQMHIRGLLKRLKEGNAPPFLYLIHSLRIQAIVIHYFPNGEDFSFISDRDYSKHPGWNDICSSRERTLMELYSIAVSNLRNDPADIDKFNEVDRNFGRYRYDKWLENVR